MAWLSRTESPRVTLLTADGRAWLASSHLPAVARPAVDLALWMIDHLEVELDTLDTQLARIARASQAAKRPSGAIGRLADRGGDLGRVRRRAPLRQQPPGGRFCGLAITITESDGKRPRGHLARQGAPVLRWARHQAAISAARPTSPDYAYYLQVNQRLGGKRAALSVAYIAGPRGLPHLGKLGDQALVPAELPTAAGTGLAIVRTLGAWIIAVVWPAP